MTRFTLPQLRASIVGATALVALSAGMTACGSSSDAGSSSTPTLKIAIGSNALNYAAYWVAEADGLFAKHHVKVDVVNSNALAVGPALLTSGQIDLLVSSVGQSVAVAAKGKPVSIIDNLYDYTVRGAAVVGGTKITSIKQLQGMGAHCTLVTTAKGTGTYAYAKQFMRAYDLHCKVSALATNALTVASMTAGQADVGTFTPTDATTVVAKNGHYLENPATITDAEAHKIVPTPFPALTATGLKATLKTKPKAVENFLAALHEALGTISSNSPQVIAKKLTKLSYFPGLSQEAMTKSLTSTLTGVPSPSSAGKVTEEAWTAALTSFQNDFDLPGFKASAPPFAYDKMVDMSYLNAALKK